MSWKSLIGPLMCFVLLQVASQNTFSQEEESAPQEAPFVQEDNEYEDFSSESEDGEVLSELPVDGASEDKAIAEEISDEQEAPLNADVPSETVVPEVEEEVPAIVQEDAEESSSEQSVTQETEQSGSSGAKRVFRRTSKGGVEYIHHPQAANGLLAITKEGAYIYKTKESREYNTTGAVRIASMNSPKIESADGTTYDTMYKDGQQPIFMFDYEWQPLTKYGKLGLQAGLGFLYSSGQGRFISNDASLSGKEAKEKYTFLAIPLNFGVVYRLEFLNRQWLAPYVAGGGTYVAVAEFRDDGKSPVMVGTPGAYGAAGMLFNVSAADRETAFVLSSEYGIANLWVSLEYRLLQTVSEDFDFSSNILGAGIVVDY